MTADTAQLDLSRVRAALDIGRPAEALRLLSLLLANDPDNSDLWTVMSEAHHDADQHAEALQAAVRAVQLDPDIGIAHYYLALGQWNTGVLGHNLRQKAVKKRAKEAQQSLREAIRLEPFQVAFPITLGKLLLQTDDHQEAELHLKRAAELSPQNTVVVLALAELALERKDAPSAERLARQVLAQEPESVEGMNILAWAQLRQRDPHLALQTALSALRMSPADPQARAYFEALSHAYLPRPLAQGSWVWRPAIIPHGGIVLVPILAVGLQLSNLWKLSRLPPDLRTAVTQVRPMRRETGALSVLGLSLLCAFIGNLLGKSAAAMAFLTLSFWLFMGLCLYWLGWQLWKRFRRRKK